MIKEIMEKDFLKVSPDMGVDDLAKIFINTKKDYALVVNAEGELLGVVTETDLIFQEKKLHIPTVFTFFDSMIFLESLSKFKEEMKKITATKVSDIMTADVTTIDESISIKDAATVMLEKDIHHLPVVEAKKPVGVVTKKCLLLAFLKERQAIS
ncbi:MAG: CBS domain-containing protein [bacterium]